MITKIFGGKGEYHHRWTGPKYCKICNSELLGEKRRRKTCGSSECIKEARNGHWKGEGNPRWIGFKSCIICGIELKAGDTRSNKTCGNPECVHIIKGHIGSSHPRWQGRKFCSICGKELIGSLARKNLTCASKDCISKALSQAGRKYETPFCKQCGREFSRRGRRQNTYFCSRECRGKWMSVNRSGKDNPLWKGGRSSVSWYKDYPSEFCEGLRRSIRKRDGYKCKSCSRELKAPDAHHIDGDKENNESQNLISLCRSCHRKVHSGKITL